MVYSYNVSVEKFYNRLFSLQPNICNIKQLCLL